MTTEEALRRYLRGPRGGLAAKDLVERRLGALPAGRVEEDGSYRTRDGRTYDPELRGLRPPRRLRPPSGALGGFKRSHA